MPNLSGSLDNQFILQNVTVYALDSYKQHQITTFLAEKIWS